MAPSAGWVVRPHLRVRVSAASVARRAVPLGSYTCSFSASTPACAVRLCGHRVPPGRRAGAGRRDPDRSSEPRSTVLPRSNGNRRRPRRVPPRRGRRRADLRPAQPAVGDPFRPGLRRGWPRRGFAGGPILTNEMKAAVTRRRRQGPSRLDDHPPAGIVVDAVAGDAADAAGLALVTWPTLAGPPDWRGVR